MKTLPNTYPVCLDDVETYMEQVWHNTEDEMPQQAIEDDYMRPILCLVLVQEHFVGAGYIKAIAIAEYHKNEWNIFGPFKDGVVQQWAYTHELMPEAIKKSINF